MLKNENYSFPISNETELTPANKIPINDIQKQYESFISNYNKNPQLLEENLHTQIVDNYNKIIETNAPQELEIWNFDLKSSKLKSLISNQERLLNDGLFFPKYYYKTLHDISVIDDAASDIIQTELLFQENQSESMSQVEFMSISALTKSVVNNVSQFNKNFDDKSQKMINYDNFEKTTSELNKSCKVKTDSISKKDYAKKFWLSQAIEVVKEETNQELVDSPFYDRQDSLYFSKDNVNTGKYEKLPFARINTAISCFEDEGLQKNISGFGKNSALAKIPDIVNKPDSKHDSSSTYKKSSTTINYDSNKPSSDSFKCSPVDDSQEESNALKQSNPDLIKSKLAKIDKESMKKQKTKAKKNKKLDQIVEEEEDLINFGQNILRQKMTSISIKSKEQLNGGEIVKASPHESELVSNDNRKFIYPPGLDHASLTSNFSKGGRMEKQLITESNFANEFLGKNQLRENESYPIYEQHNYLNKETNENNLLSKSSNMVELQHQEHIENDIFNKDLNISDTTNQKDINESKTDSPTLQHFRMSNFIHDDSYGLSLYNNDNRLNKYFHSYNNRQGSGSRKLNEFSFTKKINIVGDESPIEMLDDKGLGDRKQSSPDKICISENTFGEKLSVSDDEEDLACKNTIEKKEGLSRIKKFLGKLDHSKKNIGGDDNKLSTENEKIFSDKLDLGFLQPFVCNSVMTSELTGSNVNSARKQLSGSIEKAIIQNDIKPIQSFVIEEKAEEDTGDQDLMPEFESFEKDKKVTEQSKIIKKKHRKNKSIQMCKKSTNVKEEKVLNIKLDLSELRKKKKSSPKKSPEVKYKESNNDDSNKKNPEATEILMDQIENIEVAVNSPTFYENLDEVSPKTQVLLVTELVSANDLKDEISEQPSCNIFSSLEEKSYIKIIEKVSIIDQTETIKPQEENLQKSQSEKKKSEELSQNVSIDLKETINLEEEDLQENQEESCKPKIEYKIEILKANEDDKNIIEQTKKIDNLDFPKLKIQENDSDFSHNQIMVNSIEMSKNNSTQILDKKLNGFSLNSHLTVINLQKLDNEGQKSESNNLQNNSTAINTEKLESGIHKLGTKNFQNTSLKSLNNIFINNNEKSVIDNIIFQQSLFSKKSDNNRINTSSNVTLANALSRERPSRKRLENSLLKNTTVTCRKSLTTENDPISYYKQINKTDNNIKSIGNTFEHNKLHLKMNDNKKIERKSSNKFFNKFDGLYDKYSPSSIRNNYFNENISQASIKPDMTITEFSPSKLNQQSHKFDIKTSIDINDTDLHVLNKKLSAETYINIQKDVQYAEQDLNKNATFVNSTKESDIKHRNTNSMVIENVFKKPPLINTNAKTSYKTFFNQNTSLPPKVHALYINTTDIINEQPLDVDFLKTKTVKRKTLNNCKTEQNLTTLDTNLYVSSHPKTTNVIYKRPPHFSTENIITPTSVNSRNMPYHNLTEIKERTQNYKSYDNKIQTYRTIYTKNLNSHSVRNQNSEN